MNEYDVAGNLKHDVTVEMTRRCNAIRILLLLAATAAATTAAATAATTAATTTTTTEYRHRCLLKVLIIPATLPSFSTKSCPCALVLVSVVCKGKG